MMKGYKYKGDDKAPEIIDKATEFISKHEGLRLEPYFCLGGRKTIGYGHAIKPNEKFEKITEREALELLGDDSLYALYGVLNTTKVAINVNQSIALTSFVFNLGLKAYIASTLRQKLNRGEYFEASSEFIKWCYAGGKKVGGLLKRRLKERNLFLT
jgi:lysozyme